MQTNTRTVRSATFAAIFGLTLATGAVGIPAALELAPSAAAQTVSNIDTTRTDGSITVHKRSLPEGTATGTPTGNVDANAPGTPLAGATFTVQQVEATLGTNAGFAAARALTPATATPTGAVTTQTTDGTGVATFGSLPVGVYLVTETVTPAGHVGSAPFLVFVPMTNPNDTTQWNYNPHVYPKNTPTESVKEVEDVDQNVGDEISYKISSPVPAVPAGGSISKYIVSDNLDEAQLSTSAAQISVATSTGTPFEQGTDYTPVVDASTQQVTLTFTSAGLAKLTAAKNADAATQVVTTIKATVLAIGAGDGIAPNKATTIFNNGSGAGDTTVDSNEVETRWGKLKVVKDNAENERLQGAKFELYQCTSASALGTKITINGTDSWTTDAQGELTIDGLHVTDFENNAEVTPVTKKYCLVETEAPAGYELLPTPVEVDFTRADLDAGENKVTVVKEIENVTSTTPNLPLTGGAGIGLIAALGALLVGAGAWWAKRNSSKA